MRKILVTEFMSMDGVIEDPGGAEKFKHGGWSIPYWTEEIAKFKFDELMATGAHLLGRVTYQGFAAAWPTRKDEGGFADRMNALPKYVVSTTLKNAGWNNSTIIKEDIVEAIARLKQQSGQDLLVAGSATLIQTLMQNDLIDEYRLLVYPVLLGSGKRLFRDGGKLPLKLIETKPFSSGVVLLRYQPDHK